MRILIVEDHAGIRMALELLLEGEGYSAKAVERGEIGLELHGVEPFDVVLLDLNTDGIPAELFMRRLAKMKRPAVGVLSGSVHAESEAKRIGADFVVKKPFQHDELLAQIEKAVRQAEMGSRLVLAELNP